MITDLSLNEIKSINKAIQEKYGYDFSNYAISSFKRRMLRILELQKITPDQLVEKIKNNNFTKDEFLNEVTVNVTEMFRDPSFWKAMRTLLTGMYAQREKIKIWHAGCSSGEEVYSMMIVLHEMGVLDRTEIVASDIDKSILNKAKEGRIPLKNMEVNTSNYQRFMGTSVFENYFKKEGDFWYYDKSMLQRVSFREIDLVKAVPFSKFDLILCRNVLIYFNNVLQNDVVKLFTECMFEGGYLAIGAKESLAWCEIANKFINVNLEEKIYKKGKD